MVVVTVGRIGRPHGVRGDVTVEVRTDSPDERFTEDAVLATDPAVAGPLVVRHARWHSGRLLVRFDGVADRDSAAALRGTSLLVEVSDEPPADPEEYYDHQLVGLPMVTVAGRAVGVVRDVLHGAAQDLLVVDTATGEALVPFVSQIVPEVDLGAGRVLVDPPPGLFDVGDEQS